MAPPIFILPTPTSVHCEQVQHKLLGILTHKMKVKWSAQPPIVWLLIIMTPVNNNTKYNTKHNKFIIMIIIHC